MLDERCGQKARAIRLVDHDDDGAIREMLMALTMMMVAAVMLMRTDSDMSGEQRSTTMTPDTFDFSPISSLRIHYRILHHLEELSKCSLVV